MSGKSLDPAREDGLSADVAIIGAGISGAAAAVVLGRAGHRVTMIDRYETYPPEFRAEKIAGTQVDLFKRLGLFDALLRVGTPYGNVISARGERIVERKRTEEYGAPYQAMVATVREEIPSGVGFIKGIVMSLKTSDDIQEVRLSDGRTITARLIVLATGLNGSIVQSTGIGHRFAHKGHTLCTGFTVKPLAKACFDFEALTYYGVGVRDKIDYVSFFPMAGAIRVNIFSFHGLHEDWPLKMRDAPRETLLATLPKLKNFTGDFEVTEKPKLRTIDLRFANNYRVPGILLIGDAFQTSCPAAGTGVGRALTDVDRLCNIHIPRWLASPGMSAEKICQHYDDPVKQAADAHAQYLSKYRRAITMNTGISWRLRRRFMDRLRRAQTIAQQTAESVSRMTGTVRASISRQ
jgi:2-polyprenyl-6-methoxyphenol hydroxylase-like FAD-dependent oxidoreductase